MTPRQPADDPGEGMAWTAPGAGRIQVTAFAAFTLLGGAALLMPSLIRDVQREFSQTDAGMGLLYLLSALMLATGALLSGGLAARVGRRVVLPVAALLLGLGLAIQGLAPTWAVLLVGVVLGGAGAGTIDAGLNGVFLDFAAVGRGKAMNRLHLFYSVGALAAPLVVGTVVGAGASWRVPVLLVSAGALAIVLPMRRVGSVPPRPRAGSPAGNRTLPSLRLPLVALAFAIFTHVAAESGVSSWLVAFLAEARLFTATLALSLFWIGLAGGRLVASRIADRFPPVTFATACALFAAAFLLAAVAVPFGPGQVVLYAAAGFALGPVYPMVMSVAGTFYPHRSATVSSLITAAAIAGSVVYPPLMGLMSGSVGLGAGMLGAAVLAGISGMAVLVAGRVASRAHASASLEAPSLRGR